MRGGPTLVVGLAVTMLAGMPTRAASQQEPRATFRTGADVVAVEASVRREKRPVTGLKTSDFELLDNGVPQQISDLSYERLPIDVIVVLDVSASVTGAVLDQLRQSVRQLKTDLGPRDRLKLVAFNMQIRRLADFAAPRVGRRRRRRWRCCRVLTATQMRCRLPRLAPRNPRAGGPAY